MKCSKCGEELVVSSKGYTCRTCGYTIYQRILGLLLFVGAVAGVLYLFGGI